jgi:hypothetical protein
MVPVVCLKNGNANVVAGVSNVTVPPMIVTLSLTETGPLKIEVPAVIMAGVA